MPHNPLLAGQAITADRINKLDDQDTYTPTLTASTTAPTLGSGAAVAGWYHRNGHLITGGAIIQFGTSGTNAGSGTYAISLPFNADLSKLAANGAGRASTIGAATMYDDGTASSTWNNGTVYLGSVSTVGIQTGAEGLVSASTPWTWAASDAISISFSYLADPADLP